MNNIDDGSKITPVYVKPGFLVSGKISKMYDNGVEMTFLGGLVGTCFIDHLGGEGYKIGQKVEARVISVDPVGKGISLSMKSNIINWDQEVSQELKSIQVGQRFENAKIQQQLYGDSYLVNLQSNGLIGFLHKTHTEDKPEKKEEDDEVKEEPTKVLDVGYTFPSIKIKEINYFDRVPVLSSKGSVINSESLNYAMIKAGDFYNAKIEKVHQSKNYIKLSLNQFVKGNLNIEHMADHSLKTMPPKFTEAGKEIRVRVLNVDSSKRSLEFTKKDTLMKDDATVYQSYKDVKKGTKIIGVVVAKTEHGYVVTSFGGIKGLLTYEDVKSKQGEDYDTNQYKTGNIVKAYVLFKKRDKGVALTLSKKKAKADDAAQNVDQPGTAKALDGGLMPNAEEVEAILDDSKYSLMAKASRDSGLVGNVNQFRILEQDENKSYVIVKSVDAVKKSKNFVAILPRCLIKNHQAIETKLSSEETYEGLVLEILYSQIPVISL